MGGRRAECTLLKEQLDEHRSAAPFPLAAHEAPRRLRGGHGAVVTYSHTCAGRTFKGWISASFSFCQQIFPELPNVSAFTGGKHWLAPPPPRILLFNFYICCSAVLVFRFFPEGNVSVRLRLACPEVSAFCLTPCRKRQQQQHFQPALD